jgi:hypothetical protein
MKGASRVSIALLLLAALSASLASAGLVHAIAHSDDRSYCCCPDPDACRCTANCCSHSPALEPSSGEASGLSLRSSVSCRFPVLPEGSLARAAGPDAVPFTVSSREGHPVPSGGAARRLQTTGVRQLENLHLATSPRAPPGAPA